MGSIVKCGSARISGVLSPGEKPKTKGLTYAAMPASDFICGTLQQAAGMNLHAFATGRSTPYGRAECPVIKVATCSDLARRWHDLMDINCRHHRRRHRQHQRRGLGDVSSTTGSSQRLQKTWAEHWQLNNLLVLFDPAPVT